MGQGRGVVRCMLGDHELVVDVGFGVGCASQASATGDQSSGWACLAVSLSSKTERVKIKRLSANSPKNYYFKKSKEN